MRSKLYISILLAALMAVPAVAAPAKKKKKVSNTDLHYIAMWGGGGYSGLVNSFSTAQFNSNISAGTGTLNTFDPQFVGGGGGLVGFGYEMHHRRFMFHIGPEFRIFSSMDKLNHYSLDADGVKQPASYDAAQVDYTTMIKHYTFSNFRENQAVGQVMLPIMFGGNFDRYYFLAGAKIGYTVFDFWHQRGKLTTSVTEQMGIEDWTDVPSHNLVTVGNLVDHPEYSGTAKGRNKIGLSGGLDATISAEFGINLNEFFPAAWNEQNEEKRHPWYMRVGAFIDYGLPLLNPGSTGVALVDAQPTSVTTNSLFQSAWADKKLNSLLVGVKFTALLQLNKPKVPNPRFTVAVTDAFTTKPLTTAKVSVARPDTPKRRPQQKAVKKDGMFQGRFAKATYALSSTAPGYINSDTALLQHEVDLRDTVRFAMIPNPRLTALVHDLNTEQLISATITFTNDRDGKETKVTAKADTKEVIAMLHYGDTYKLKISSPNYHDTVASVSDLYATEHYYLRPIKRVRRTLILKHMYFPTDKTDILPASEGDLQTLYNFLNDNPKIRVLITGHTDSQGSDTYNQRLSEGRSAAVKAEMVRRGIAEDRIETDGKGESEPIDTNDTEEGRQNNRRVQVTVLNADEAEVDVY
ncbi:MAG: OmpA family protein [Paludibacteraceae bacterium]|nr:OmpA family protein [Paludibacteraceae bacterium]